MRIGVIGAGAVGGAIAALLARGGHDVEVTARGQNLKVIEGGGLRLTGDWGNFTVPVEASEKLVHAPELVFVATKAQDARVAILENEKLLGGIPVVVVQNGLGALTTAREVLPRSDVLGGLAMYASSLVRAGEITITTPGPTYIGGGEDVPARFAAAVLGAVMPTTAILNFVGAQWTKLIVNQVNALPAVTGLSVQEVVANAGLRRIMTLSMQEQVRVAARAGITFASIQGLTNLRLRALAVAPVSVAQSLPKLIAGRMGSTPNPGSTLQSVRRGVPTEIDYLNGAVVAAAIDAGTTAPVNAALVGLVHQVEQSSTFMTPDEVIARLAAVSK